MLGGTVGDQDWLTLLAWAQPHLVYSLPCQFNVQTDQVSFAFLKGLPGHYQVYNTAKWADVWDKYRNCPNSTMIRHNNGDWENSPKYHENKHSFWNLFVTKLYINECIVCESYHQNNSFRDTQSQILSDQQNTADPTVSTHKKARKNFDPKIVDFDEGNWIWKNGPC